MTVKQQQSKLTTPPVEASCPIASDDKAISRIDEDARSRPIRALHVLSVSVPHLNGYTMRSKYIIHTQRDQNMAQPTVVTSPFYAGNPASISDETIDGIEYRRIAHPVDMTSRRRWDERMCAFCFRLRKRLRTSGAKVRAAIRRATVLPAKRVRYRIGRLGRLLVRFCRLTIRRIVTQRTYWQFAMRQCRRGRVRVRRLLHRVIGWPSPTIPATSPARSSEQAEALPNDAVKSAWRIPRTPEQHEPPHSAERTQPADSPTKPAAPGILSIKGCIRRLSWALEAIEEFCLARRFHRELRRVVEEVQPEVIHAHSPYRCGLPALRVAREFGLPMVYEVRGLWEDSGVAEGNFTIESAKYRYWRTNETQVMRGADVVVCICEELRREIESRGVASEKIVVVPNAVDAAAFRPADAVGLASAPPQVQEVRKKLRRLTIGYVGSIRRLEGVGETVRGAGQMLRNGYDVSLLIVGDGPGLGELKELAAEEGLAERVVFTGRVPHDLVRHYYALIDVFVVSRPAMRVTKMVTPLKPLEAMAMGKALLVSDLPALREIVSHNETGLTYAPGDVEDFARQCARYADDVDYRNQIADTARRWVQECRSWQRVLQPLPEAYAAIGKHPAVSTG